MQFEPVIGLEVHAELATQSKMFCACPVLDSTRALPNQAVCPVCAGMPGALPVLNRRAVEYGLRVALALDCQIAPISIFARKNYFYPDLPKGYQISQYEQPLARKGHLTIQTGQGELSITIRRVHLEEDTGKLTHVVQGESSCSLVDLNRAGVPLMEIVTEPELHTPEQVRQCAAALRSLLRYLGVNSGDMEKGVLRIEPNISIRPVGSHTLGIRTEIKNLNSLRALERSVAHEIQRQIELVQSGQMVLQETRGWDEIRGITVSQRRKESEDDYRYFPEPDLPPLVIDPGWLEEIRSSLPELPTARLRRFQEQYALNVYDASLLTAEPVVADFFERVVQCAPPVPPKMIANWIVGELFGLFNKAGIPIEAERVTPENLAGLLILVHTGKINQNSAKRALEEMFASGKTAQQIVSESGMQQISDPAQIARLVENVLAAYPEQAMAYQKGKESLMRWLIGQVMHAAQGHANPALVEQELRRRLKLTR
jgi:aspartyl-tRNA(Asn)/glutamyl-tRNA(Gln) amidotransferase subunit B